MYNNFQSVSQQTTDNFPPTTIRFCGEARSIGDGAKDIAYYSLPNCGYKNRSCY